MKTPTYKALACLLALTLATCAAFFTTGCASTDRSITKQDVITALEITAALTIGDDLRKAETALRIVADARRFIAEGEQLSAKGAIAYIAEQALRSTSMTPAQQIAVRAFVDRFAQNFTIETDTIGISPEIVVTVNEALDAIEAVATEIQTYGAAQPRTYAAQQPRRQDLIGHIFGLREKPATDQPR